MQSRAVPLFSWLHVSDLHFGHGSAENRFDQGLVLQVLQRDVQRLFDEGRVPTPDVILVTGDIVFSGNSRSSDEYATATQYLDKLAHGIKLSREQVFVVPGNHDVDRRVDRKIPIRRLLSALRTDGEQLDEVLTSTYDSALLGRRQANYRSFAKQFAPACRADAQDINRLDVWTHRLSPRGVPVRLVGLNTALLSSDDRDKGRLAVGIGALHAALDPPPDIEREIVLFLGHHPLREGWLSNEAKISALMKRYGRLYLSGHMHSHESEDARSGAGTNFIWLSAGATHSELNHRVQGYNFAGVFADEKNCLRLQIWPRVWDHKNARFVVDHVNTPDGRGYAEHRLGTLASDAATKRGNEAGVPLRMAQRGQTESGQSKQAVLTSAMPVPTLASLRGLLHKVLPTDADFSAFCLDYFPEAAHRFSNGMDLMAKITLLFHYAEPDLILKRLQLYDSQRLIRYQGMLEFEDQED